jgi:hypothetical protein
MIDPIGELAALQSFTLESSESIDLSPLGSLPVLRSLDIDCYEASGHGALAACPMLDHLKLSTVPDYPCPDLPRCKFGSSEFNKLMSTWKGVHTRSGKVCGSCAESGDIAVFLLGLNLLECLSTKISIDQFCQRLEQLSLRHSDQLRSRCYWPILSGASDAFNNSHPVGQWMERARRAGALSNETCAELSAVLAERLPSAPER